MSKFRFIIMTEDEVSGTNDRAVAVDFVKEGQVAIEIMPTGEVLVLDEDGEGTEVEPV